MSYTLKEFLLISLLLLSVLNLLAQQNCIFREGETVEISIGSTEAEVVNTALSMFRMITGKYLVQKQTFRQMVKL